MDNISKHQVILICLLVALVTAITSSIATVSLIDSGDTQGSQTIYQVIEKSIDKVADIPTVKNIVAPISTPKGPVILPPSDIADNVAKSIVQIYELYPDNSKQFVALGVAIGSKDGILVSNTFSTISQSGAYVMLTPSGQTVPLQYVKGGIANTLTYFTASYTTGEKNKVPPLATKSISTNKLGINIVTIGGKENGNVVSTGIITDNTVDHSRATSTALFMSDIKLSSPYSGWLVFDNTGALVGFESYFDLGNEPVFVSANIVVGELAPFL